MEQFHNLSPKNDPKTEEQAPGPQNIVQGPREEDVAAKLDDDHVDGEAHDPDPNEHRPVAEAREDIRLRAQPPRVDHVEQDHQDERVEDHRVVL